MGIILYERRADGLRNGLNPWMTIRVFPFGGAFLEAKCVRFVNLSFSFLWIFFLTGCLGANEEFIQGRWEFEEPHLKNLPAEPHLTTTWEFNGGTFYYYACCFNQETELSGRYRILSDEGNIITLELFNVKGSASRIGGELRIEINPETDRLTIINGGPYIRLTP